MIVLGVDPGSKTTGCVVREGDRLLDHALVPLSELGGLRAMTDAVADLERLYEPDVVAVEDVVGPNAHLGLTNVKGLLETAQVLGALRLAFDPVLVRPAGFGRAWLASYRVQCVKHDDTCLVGDSETQGTGIRRHLRSAFDVAGAASSVQQQWEVS